MRRIYFFALGFCFLTFGFSQKIYAQDMGNVDEATVEETEAVNSEEAQAEEAPKKSNIFVRVANIFMNLPFGYDLGSEPTLHGSLTYFNLKYRWSDEKQIFSRLNFYYGTTMSVSPKEKDLLSDHFILLQYLHRLENLFLLLWIFYTLLYIFTGEKTRLIYLQIFTKHQLKY